MAWIRRHSSVEARGRGVVDGLRRPRLLDEAGLRAWLTKEGITGYAFTLLVMEQFGYPDFLLASADDLIEDQYADRPQLRTTLTVGQDRLGQRGRPASP